MNMLSRLWFAIVLAPMLASMAHAQTQRSGDANARAMQQLQQLSGERAALKAENDKLKAELESLKAQLTTAQSGQADAQKRLKALEANAQRESNGAATAAAQLETLRAQTQELVARFRETAQSLKEVEVDRNAARRDLTARDRELAACATRNRDLYALSTEVLDRMESQGMFGRLAEQEPFTKIKRTQLENLIDGYRERAADARQTATH